MSLGKGNQIVMKKKINLTIDTSFQEKQYGYRDPTYLYQEQEEEEETNLMEELTFNQLNQGVQSIVTEEISEEISDAQRLFNDKYLRAKEYTENQKVKDNQSIMLQTYLPEKEQRNIVNKITNKITGNSSSLLQSMRSPKIFEKKEYKEVKNIMSKSTNKQMNKSAYNESNLQFMVNDLKQINTKHSVDGKYSNRFSQQKHNKSMVLNWNQLKRQVQNMKNIIGSLKTKQIIKYNKNIKNNSIKEKQRRQKLLNTNNLAQQKYNYLVCNYPKYQKHNVKNVSPYQAFYRPNYKVYDQPSYSSYSKFGNNYPQQTD